MGNIFCQQSVPWELHCEPSELILNFFYQSLFHRFHYLHGLLFFQHFKHNVWLVVNVDVTGQCLGREQLSWSPRGVCRLGAAQAGEGQGWAAVTFLTQQPRYSKGSWGFCSNICREWCFFTLPHCPQGEHLLFSLSLLLCPLFGIPLRLAPHTLFLSTVLLRSIVFLSLRSLHF